MTLSGAPREGLRQYSLRSGGHVLPLHRIDALPGLADDGWCLVDEKIDKGQLVINYRTVTRIDPDVGRLKARIRAETLILARLNAGHD